MFSDVKFISQISACFSLPNPNVYFALREIDFKLSANFLARLRSTTRNRKRYVVCSDGERRDVAL